MAAVSAGIITTETPLWTDPPPPSTTHPGKFRLKKICDWAAEAGFTHILVLSERYKVVNRLVLKAFSSRLRYSPFDWEGPPPSLFRHPSVCLPFHVSPPLQLGHHPPPPRPQRVLQDDLGFPVVRDCGPRQRHGAHPRGPLERLRHAPRPARGAALCLALPAGKQGGHMID